ncbi:hypothetical protein FHP25_32515 [Vineibacter terrae]|uniref:Uncharacterized protein n=1 Tax=Vineibacter terrae TaxID=2586908 RepID=A0A5C8PAM2_9HYPH|nr:hypothetical protein [Vineibacter terrae]TXL70846.1 hypothetical protein FHP25_32515 [Vineibacter terrae]
MDAKPGSAFRPIVIGAVLGGALGLLDTFPSTLQAAEKALVRVAAFATLGVVGAVVVLYILRSGKGS